MNILVRLLMMGLFLFGAVPLSYANVNMSDNSHSKTKTLATLGSGSINVADEENSDTTMLNRDINDNEVDVYDIESHKGIKGSLDTNLLTEQGRDKIAEDIMKSGMIVDTVRQIVMDDTVGITEFFSETEKQHKTYEAVKEKIATDPALAAQLQDPNLNPQEKEAMLNGITDAVMVKLGYTTHENVIVANANDPRAGHISAESGKTTAYINDANAYVDSTGKLVTVAGHEASHAIDSQSGKTYVKGTRESYATNYGENLTNFTDMALDINGYDNGMATSNNHVGNRSEYVTHNTAAYNQLDKAKGDDFLMASEQRNLADKLNSCNGDARCQGAAKGEARKQYNVNRAKILAEAEACQASTGCMTKAKAKRYNSLLNDRPFRGEVVYTKGGEETKRVRGGTYTVDVPDSFEAKVNIEEKEAAVKAVKMVGSVTPYVGPIIVAVDIAKGVEKAVETGDPTDAIKAVGLAVVPPSVRSGLGITKKGNIPDAADAAGLVSGEVAGGLTDE